MPELPEVQTTVNGIMRYAKSKKIVSVWTDYGGPFHNGKSNIKDKKYFAGFKKAVEGRMITGAERIGKNVVIHLSGLPVRGHAQSGGKSIIVHMKMTGHLLYGRYREENGVWQALEKGPLRDDTFNRFIHLVFSLSDGRHLALSDMRKFARVSVVDTATLPHADGLDAIGPDPLAKNFSYKIFKDRILRRPKGKIKQVLMDQTLIAGIGNIYSDEILWRAGVHPSTSPQAIPEAELKKMYKATGETLARGIDFGGDSMSDYRNILGEPGKFQSKHEAYRRTGKPCRKKGCGGTIHRLKIGARSGHFCPVHQKLFLSSKYSKK